MTLPVIEIPGAAEQWVVWVDLYREGSGGAIVAAGPFATALEAGEWKATIDEHPPPVLQMVRGPLRLFPAKLVEAGVWPS